MFIQRCSSTIFLFVLLVLPLNAGASEPMSLGGLSLGMTQAEVMAEAQTLGLVPNETQGQGLNTTLHTFRGTVYGLNPLTFSCFFQDGFLSDIVIDFSPDTAGDVSKLKSSIANLKSEWDTRYGSDKNVFKFAQEEGLNKLSWDLPGRKAGIDYDDEYAGASFYVRVKLGVPAN